MKQSGVNSSKGGITRLRSRPVLSELCLTGSYFPDSKLLQVMCSFSGSDEGNIVLQFATLIVTDVTEPRKFNSNASHCTEHLL